MVEFACFIVGYVGYLVGINMDSELWGGAVKRTYVRVEIG